MLLLLFRPQIRGLPWFRSPRLRFTDPEEAVAFTEKIQEKTKMNIEAFVVC